MGHIDRSLGHIDTVSGTHRYSHGHINSPWDTNTVLSHIHSPWDTSIQSLCHFDPIHVHPPRSISSHLRLDLPRCLSCSGCPTKPLYTIRSLRHINTVPGPHQYSPSATSIQSTPIYPIQYLPTYAYIYQDVSPVQAVRPNRCIHFSLKPDVFRPSDFHLS